MTNPTEPTTSKLDQLVERTQSATLYVHEGSPGDGWELDGEPWDADPHKLLSGTHTLQRWKRILSPAEIQAAELEAGGDLSRMEWAKLVQEEIAKRQSAEASLARMTEERDEADRLAGMATRERDRLREAAQKEQSWLYDAKIERGASINDSFDRVWAETCALADRTLAAEASLSQLQADAGGERLRAALEKIREKASYGQRGQFRIIAEIASLALSGGTEKQGLSSSVADQEGTQ